MPLKIPKWLVTGILKTFTLIQEVLKLSKSYGKQVLAIENNTLFLLGDGFTKNGQFPFIDEFSLKTNKQKTVYLYL
jgi:hypothetical protein